MIFCPNCKHQELAGALFCSECGAQIRDYGEWNTQPFDGGITESVERLDFGVDGDKATLNNESAFHLSDEVVSLRLKDADRIINLTGRTEYTLGRVSEDQPIVPDVDLTEFEAYIQGVSRLHAALKIGRQRISIQDLGSSNGTRVNGQRIVPHVDYPLKHGDAIALGKMQIEIVISLP